MLPGTTKTWTCFNGGIWQVAVTIFVSTHWGEEIGVAVHSWLRMGFSWELCAWTFLGTISRFIWIWFQLSTQQGICRFLKNMYLKEYVAINMFFFPSSHLNSGGRCFSAQNISGKIFCLSYGWLWTAEGVSQDEGRLKGSANGYAQYLQVRLWGKVLQLVFPFSFLENANSNIFFSLSLLAVEGCVCVC